MSAESLRQLTPPVSETDHVRGNLDATILFVEYGDYECPHCLQAHSIMKELEERLQDRITYVFRHFPIRSSHPTAQKAAEAAEAAAAQGKFWEMHDLLFENQGDLSLARLEECAVTLGLDVERFSRELEEGIYADKVEQDFRSGARSGVNGTPTFYINQERYDGPWDVESLTTEMQKPVGVQVRNLFQRFTRIQASGGILLILTTLVALILANSDFAERYVAFWKTDFSITFGGEGLTKDLLKWINDGLMVIFFFVVGLEIKREVTVGELATARKATLPIMAAIGGMAVPALIYSLFNWGGLGESGWAIPMATDIAFALGVLALFGNRIPLSLRVFFTALAIVDDLGAVLVIALFYSEQILWNALGAGGVILILLLILNRTGIRNPLPYAILGIGLWYAFLQSGVHPTIAGVLLALMIPARTQVRAQAFLAQCTAVLGGVRPEVSLEEVDLTDRQQAAARALEGIAERLQTPAQRLEHTLTPWASYLVLPIFALANAGVVLTGGFGEGTTQISLGIILGLLIGKPLGITAFTWLAVRLKIAEMPARVDWPQLFSATWLAGIGFTMALFITDSAFADPAVLNSAKIAILIASLSAGLIGSSLLALTSFSRKGATELEPVPAV
jgi:NhaA family Na+:H+ antiporter